MARITVEDCLQQVGDGHRFSLIQLAIKRIKQHRQGEPYLVDGKNKEVVMSLREIAAGLVTFENIDLLPGTSDKNEAHQDHKHEAEEEL